MRNESERRIDRLKIVAGISAVSFAATLAAFIGNRLSNESLAVLAGAVCGVGAAIPTSLLVIAVTRRNDSNQVSRAQPNSQTFPPVVVVAPPGIQQQPIALPPPGQPLTTIPYPAREFIIVGDEYE